MQPDELYDTLAETAKDDLREIYPEFESGGITRVSHVHAYLALYRQLGVCRMLANGLPDELFVSQQQTASGYLFRLPGLDPDDLATSVAGVWWDAVGGQYWEAAQAIAERSRDTWNPKREHEEDFLYVRFLMKRYLLAAEPSEQGQMLDRWVEIIEDELSPRLDFCRALLESRPDDVLDGLERMGDARAQEVTRKIDAGTFGYELAAWLRPYWNEGLALIRLLEHEGIEVPPMFTQVPEIARRPCPYRYHPDAWRSVGFRPSVRR
ncbi:MAG: hypothetical protein AB1Z98_30465 [Nannocystaceae bacterium]